ncbi:MAG: LCP family protein [Anaerovoracaceae bacterium]|jgi:LCP family protein required for cell wall assembly
MRSDKGRGSRSGRSGRGLERERPSRSGASRDTIVSGRGGDRPRPRPRPQTGRGSDYERDVELYRRIVEGDSGGAHRRAESRPRTYEAPDAGTPRTRKKTRSEKYRENYYGEGRQGRQSRDPRADRKARERRDRQREQQYEKQRRQLLKQQKKKNKKLKKRPKSRHKGRKIFLSLLLIFVILFTGGFFYFNAYASNLATVDTTGEDFGINSGVSSSLWRYTDIAILGSDARAGESYEGSRTDAVVIMRIDKLTGEIRLVSCLRDSYLQMDDGNGGTTYSKLTHAFSYGGGVNTCKTLNQSLDLNIKKYIVFNWRAVSDTVYCLHGITINIKESEIDDMNSTGNNTAANVGRTYTPITHAGKQTLDGAQVATYCRIRKTSGGDTERARRYKATLKAIIAKAKSSDLKMLNNTAKWVLPKISTNMSSFYMYTWIIQAWRLNISNNISFPNTFYGATLSDGVWYAVPQTLESNVVWLHKKLFDDDNYQVSSECSTQSEEIQNLTGVY